MTKPLSALDSLWASYATPTPNRTAKAPPRARLEVEGLEDRTVLSGGLSSPPVAAPLSLNKIVMRQDMAGQSASASLRRITRQVKNLLASQGLKIDQVIVNTSGQLQAIGSVLGQAVNIPLSILNYQVTSGSPSTAILDLQLGPINLNLLGLVVRTTPICLKITATQGQGILGDLLTGIANPGSLTQVQRADLLTQLFNGGLGNLLTQQLSQAVQVKAKGDVTGLPPLPSGHRCPILRLNLGPVQLNLLGLNVRLDACNGDQPITVDITAVRGAGLLGNLLCGLVGGNQGNASARRG